MIEGGVSTSSSSEDFQRKAEVQKSRAQFGLSAFFRPQKTVSPLTQQTVPDGTRAAKEESRAPTSSALTQHGGDLSTDNCSAWGTLPEHLVEAVMQLLLEQSQHSLQSASKSDKQVLSAMPSVCFHI